MKPRHREVGPAAKEYLGDMELYQSRLLKLSAEGSWTRNGNGECASNNTFYRQFKGYLSFLVREGRVDAAEAGLSCLLNESHLLDYYDRCKDKGLSTTGEMFFAQIIMESKFPSYTSFYHASESIHDLKSLQKILFGIHELATHCCEDFNENAEYIDAKRHISFLLDQPDMIPAIKDFQDTLDQRILWYRRRSKASMNAASIAAMFRIGINGRTPLRVAAFSELVYLGESTKSLVRKKGFPCIYFDREYEHYSIWVPKIYLKNRRNKNISDLYRMMPKSITEWLNYYADSMGTKIGDRFFRAGSADTLGSRFKDVTKHVGRILYPEEPFDNGINPHALRHLTATIYLNENPDNYIGLAALLHDSLATVLMVYAKMDYDAQGEAIMGFFDKTFGVAA